MNSKAEGCACADEVKTLPRFASSPPITKVYIKGG